jgi:hypothetical protein
VGLSRVRAYETGLVSELQQGVYNTVYGSVIANGTCYGTLFACTVDAYFHESKDLEPAGDSSRCNAYMGIGQYAVIDPAREWLGEA